MKIPYNLDALSAVIKKQTILAKKSPDKVFDLIEEEIIKQSELITDQINQEQNMYNNFIYYIEK